MTECILCNSVNLEDYINYETIRLEKNTKVLKCNDCELKFIYPRHLDIDKNWISQDNSRKAISYDSKDRDTVTIKNHEAYYEHIKNNINYKEKLQVLDIGSGYSYAGLLWLSENNNIKLTLLEASDTVEKGIDFFLIKNKHLNKDFIEEHKKSIQIKNVALEDFKTHQVFDVITLWHVLEHVLNPVFCLNKIYDLLVDNGIFLLEIPNDDDDLNMFKEFKDITHFTSHMSYFNKKSILLALNKSKFKDSKITIKGVQRYGFYNYVDWIKYQEKKNVKDDDYRNKDRSEIEKLWLEHKKNTFTCDTLFIKVLKKKKK